MAGIIVVLAGSWLIPQGDAIELGGWATLLFFLYQVIVAPGIVTWYLHRKYRAETPIKLDL